MIYAKKYLGQHFLKNKAKLRKIVDALELKSGDVVVEIGPGHGELTRLLAEKSKIQNPKSQIVAIEKDRELAGELKEKFKEDKNIEIIEGDVLKILPLIIHNSKFKNQNYKIVGNIPYYITGYLFRILGELEHKPSLIVLLIQKEVAKRIVVKPPHMNLLAASVQIWAEPKIIGYVSRKDFSPAPKVDSAIIRLRIKNYELGIMDNYYQFIKVLFKQPRKTIMNNLLSGIMNYAMPVGRQELRIMNKQEIIEKLKEVGVEANARPQDLSVEEIIKILLAAF